MNRLYGIIFISTFSWAFCVLSGDKAVIIVPVADLIGQPMRVFHARKPVHTAYNELPWWQGLSPQDNTCPRLHQALFNEMVTVIKTTKDEALVRIPNIYYLVHTSPKPQTDYWTLKKNIMFLSDMRRHNIDLSTLPEPVNFECTDLSVCHRNTITITDPVYDAKTNLTFSAGTRFVKTNEQAVSDKITVYVFDPASKTNKTIALDKKITRSYDDHPREQRIRDFVDLLRQWAHTDSIPYVWGGCSFTHAHQDTFENRYQIGTGEGNHNAPKTGFDCSGVIARAAQTVGIPYFFKNTYTLVQNLKLLEKNEKLEEGDLIWIRGHVMAVADLQKNTLIEARSYEGGYGKVQEIALNRVFKGIKTYHDLENCYYQKQKLQRLNAKGDIMDSFSHCKLLKIASVWK